MSVKSSYQISQCWHMDIQYTVDSVWFHYLDIESYSYASNSLTSWLRFCLTCCERHARRFVWQLNKCWQTIESDKANNRVMSEPCHERSVCFSVMFLPFSCCSVCLKRGKKRQRKGSYRVWEWMSSGFEQICATNRAYLNNNIFPENKKWH